MYVMLIIWATKLAFIENLSCLWRSSFLISAKMSKHRIKIYIFLVGIAENIFDEI